MRLDEMTCWARYKYSKTDSAIRVHVWDIFDEALLETKTFDAVFERLFQKLSELYINQGFDLDQEEVVKSADGESSASEGGDSADDQLLNALDKCTRTNFVKKKTLEEDDFEIDDELDCFNEDCLIEESSSSKKHCSSTGSPR